MKSNAIRHLVSLILIIASMLFVSASQACGSYQTCNNVFILDTRTVPATETVNGAQSVKFKPSLDTIKFEMDIMEFANWYWTASSTM